MQKETIGKLVVMIQSLLIFSSKSTNTDINSLIEAFELTEEEKKREGGYNYSKYEEFYRGLEELIREEGPDISITGVMNIRNTLDKYKE